MVAFLYSILLNISYAAIAFSSLWSKKNRKWIRGRKGLFTNLKNDLKNINKKIIWMHCSSLGEFEQGRPVLEALKEKYKDYALLLTFFSPSGYDIRKNFPAADLIYYMPLDGACRSKKFLSIVNPSAVIFVKYDYWYFYFRYLKKQHIPLFLLSGIFRKSQVFFKWYGSFFRKMLGCVTRFFVQDENSKKLLKGIGFYNVDIITDTRIDRVYQISREASLSTLEIVQTFKNNELLLIAGSSYHTEEDYIHRLMVSEKLTAKVIIAPHKTDESHIRQIIDLFGDDAVLWSDAQVMSSEILAAYRVLVIDTIGLLAYLYKYGDIAFIGGGFGKSIHNILEPATFGLPVIMGPANHENFREAVDLVNIGGACIVNDYEEFMQNYLMLTDEKTRSKASTICKAYISGNIGGTELFISSLQDWL